MPPAGGYRGPSKADQEAEDRAIAERLGKLAAERNGRENAWRLRRMIDLGLRLHAAEALVDWRADWHRIRRMLAAGATQGQVLEIFRPEGADMPTEPVYEQLTAAPADPGAWERTA